MGMQRVAPQIEATFGPFAVAGATATAATAAARATETSNRNIVSYSGDHCAVPPPKTSARESLTRGLTGSDPGFAYRGDQLETWSRQPCCGS